MTTITQTLASFLLDRIAEDEAAARDADDVCPAPWRRSENMYSSRPGYLADAVDSAVAHTAPVFQHHMSRHDPARVLAECAAKRAIVETLIVPYIAERRRLMNGQPSWSDEHPDLLLLLASVYRDHEDWREEGA